MTTDAIIETELRKATNHIGTRVVANLDGRSGTELYDWNRSDIANHKAAAKLVAPEGELTLIGSRNDDTLFWRVREGW